MRAASCHQDHHRQRGTRSSAYSTFYFGRKEPPLVVYFVRQLLQEPRRKAIFGGSSFRHATTRCNRTLLLRLMGGMSVKSGTDATTGGLTMRQRRIDAPPRTAFWIAKGRRRELSTTAPDPLQDASGF